ncbi:MAG: hypothetical protein JWO04_1481 [Gammaproteobacteria bacterium]|nr:hypothetical protein [Gammaproteobacteria bacterium]
MWLDHLCNNICDCNEALINYILNYYAHAVQKPGERPEVALVFRGGKGVGKGTVIKPLELIFGNHFYQTQNMDRVIGRFNSVIQNKLVVFLNETVWGGYQEMDSRLKGLITEPTTDVEPKNINSYTVKNYKRVIIDSNEDWAVPFSMDERRYCVINIPEHEYKQDHTYFGKVYEELYNGGAAGLMDLLRKRDISNFSPRKLPEGNNERGADMAVRSLNTIQDFLLNWLDEGGVRFAEAVGRPDFHQRYLTHCRDSQRRPDPKSQFFDQVQKITQATVVKTSGHYEFRFPTLEHMRSTFETLVLKRKHNWGGVDHA